MLKNMKDIASSSKMIQNTSKKLYLTCPNTVKKLSLPLIPAVNTNNRKKLWRCYAQLLEEISLKTDFLYYQKWKSQWYKYSSKLTFGSLKQVSLIPTIKVTQINKIQGMSRPLFETVIAQSLFFVQN